MKTLSRYSRQTILPEIGVKGQERLSKARVLVIGAGGLGCPVLQYLAGAGVGTIGIVDYDYVDINNLQRQILFSHKDQGNYKAFVARDRLLTLNPEIEIKAYVEEVNDQNAISLFTDYDVLVDGTDNFATKFLINDVAIKLGKPVVYGAIQGFEGQVSIFDAKRGPCYRCLYPNIPQVPVMNCAEAGVVGALAGIIGTMQAMEVIKLLVAHESFQPLFGQLWLIDTKSMEINTLTIPKRCSICSRSTAEIVPHYTPLSCSSTHVKEISCDEPIPTNAVFVDVREQKEWEAGHIEQAYHLPLPELQKNPDMFSCKKGSFYIFYCQHGIRSKRAVQILQQTGFTDIYSLKGGYEAWGQYNK